MIIELQKRLTDRQKQLQGMLVTRAKLESQLTQVNEAICQYQGAIFELDEMIKEENKTKPGEGESEIQDIAEEKKHEDVKQSDPKK